MEIKNITFKIPETCSAEHKKIIESYWEINDLFEFINQPTQIRSTYNLAQYELIKLVETKSRLRFYIYCSTCKSYEKQVVFNQTKFKEKIRKIYSFKCSNCRESEKTQKEHLKEVKQLALVIKINEAIDNKHWEKLSDFQYKLLHHCLTLDYERIKSIYWLKLGKSKFGKLFFELEQLERSGLIIVIKDEWDDKTLNYHYHPRLKEVFKYTPRINSPEFEFSREGSIANQLKFILTSNENNYHPDSPKYAGIVKFHKRIIIEPNIDYVFAQWKTNKNDLYLTLIPKDDTSLYPKQNLMTDLSPILNETLQDVLVKMKPNF